MADLTDSIWAWATDQIARLQGLPAPGDAARLHAELEEGMRKARATEEQIRQGHEELDRVLSSAGPIFDRYSPYSTAPQRWATGTPRPGDIALPTPGSLLMIAVVVGAGVLLLAALLGRR